MTYEGRVIHSDGVVFTILGSDPDGAGVQFSYQARDDEESVTLTQAQMQKQFVFFEIDGRGAARFVRAE
jgi:hypothetical protein